jgi:NTE family protein
MPAGIAEVGLEGLQIFSGLDGEDRDALMAACVRRTVRRGEVLVREGEEADSVFLVMSGRFAVTIGAASEPIGEIGPGQPIGEITFLAGGRRSATITALRDAIILTLERGTLERIAADRPRIWRALATVLAERLRANVQRSAVASVGQEPRTIAVIGAGGSPVPPGFVERLHRVLSHTGRSIVVDHADLRARLRSAHATLDGDAATELLNGLEASHRFLVLPVTDRDEAFAEKAIHHADVVLAVGFAEADPTPSVREQLANRFLARSNRHLVLVHPSRRTPKGTTSWLRGRELAMHHHACLADNADVERIVRFLCGRATGLVACGGGALCCGQVGVYAAFRDAGFGFDMLGGTSAGSAMTAAFGLGWSPEAIDEAIHEIFVANGAMRRYTLPRYSLLDHTHFDRHLARYYAGNAIEDMWRPYFAVSSDLSTGRIHVHTTGDVWDAIRASSSIPALLPPVYSADGHMLVDGAILSNVPLTTMQQLKRGPNAVVVFDLERTAYDSVDYRALPSRFGLLGQLAQPWRRLPSAPGVAEVMTRSLMVSRQDFRGHLGPEDVLFQPPLPRGATFLDWHRHTELMSGAREWARTEVARLASANHPLLAATR